MTGPDTGKVYRMPAALPDLLSTMTSKPNKDDLNRAPRDCAAACMMSGHGEEVPAHGNSNYLEHDGKLETGFASNRVTLCTIILLVLLHLGVKMAVDIDMRRLKGYLGY